MRNELRVLKGEKGGPGHGDAGIYNDGAWFIVVTLDPCQLPNLPRLQQV